VKQFLLALLLSALSATASASCPSGTVREWTLDNTANDVCGGVALYVTTPAYTTSPGPPSPSTYWATSFGTNSYFRDSTQADFSLTQGGLQFAVNQASYAGGGYFPIAVNGTGTHGFRWLNIQIYANQVYLMLDNVTYGPFSSLTNGTTYYFNFAWWSGGVNLYMGTSKGSLSSLYSSGTPMPSAGTTLTQLTIGSENGAGFVVGTIGQVRLMSVTSTTWVTDPGLPTPTPTPNYTATNTPTPWVTPTPMGTIVPCGTPFPTVFVTAAVPVLVGAGTTSGGQDGNWLAEPTVIMGADGVTLWMLYSGACEGGVGTEAVYLATSTDGLSWTKYQSQPVLGQGHGGESGYARAAEWTKVGSTYYVYYNVNGQIWYTTTTNGHTFTTPTQLLTTLEFQNAGLCNIPLAYDSFGVAYNGTSYWGLACVPIQGSCLPWSGRGWIEWLFGASGPTGTFVPIMPVPLDSMTSTAPGQSGQLYCARQQIKVSSRWHAWPFFGYPTSIWHSTSLDGFNWQTDATAVLPLPTSPFYGLTACNQLADPSVVEAYGSTFMYFSANDNANAKGNIGVAVYNGTLAQYNSCTLPATPTPTPTATPICANLGELTPFTTPAPGWSKVYYKPVVIPITTPGLFGAPQRICTVNVYIVGGAGQLQAAYYDNSAPPTGVFPAHLVATSATRAAIAGWNTLSFPYPASFTQGGNGFIAVSASGNLAVGSKSPGADCYLNSMWGGFVSLIFNAWPTGTDNSIYAQFCSY
jgi:hypothetical protein